MRPAAAPLCRNPGEQHRELDVLDRLEVGDEVPGEVLPEKADVATEVGEEIGTERGGEVEIGNRDLSGRRRIHPSDDLEKARLPRPPDDGNELARPRFEVDALQRHHLERALLVDLDDVLAMHDGIAHRSTSLKTSLSRRADTLRVLHNTDPTSSPATTAM